jgi:hypothetical protein
MMKSIGAGVKRERARISREFDKLLAATRAAAPSVDEREHVLIIESVLTELREANRRLLIAAADAAPAIAYEDRLAIVMAALDFMHQDVKISAAITPTELEVAAT